MMHDEIEKFAEYLFVNAITASPHGWVIKVPDAIKASRVMQQLLREIRECQDEVYQLASTVAEIEERKAK